MNSGETERLWKLQASANSLVLEGKKDAESLLDFLQVFVFGNALLDIDWPGTYKTFGMEAEYKKAMKKLPVWQNTNLWVVPVIGIGEKRVGCNMVVAAMRKRFEVWSYYDDLDANIARNDRSPANGSYSMAICCNTERVHHAFQNKLSPIQFMIQWQKEQLLTYQTTPHTIKFPYESKVGWRYTNV